MGRYGSYYTIPDTKKHPENGENKHSTWSLDAMQGWRSSSEDAHLAVIVKQKHDKKRGMLSCVFDGHAGKEAAVFCA